MRVFNPVVYTLSLGFINLDRDPKYYVKRCVGRYFMMGDNRDESFDSRYWGFANRDDIYGRAVFRVWPLKALGPLR